MGTTATSRGSNQSRFDAFTDKHPVLAGYVLVELLVVLMAFVLDYAAGPVRDTGRILNVLAGLFGAGAVVLGCLGVLLFGGYFAATRLS